MSSIKVSPEELVVAAGHIQSAIAIGDDVRSKHGTLDGEASAAGRGDVEDALSAFMSAWSYGLQCINKDGQTLGSFLQLAGKSYEAAEAKIANAAGP